MTALVAASSFSTMVMTSIFVLVILNTLSLISPYLMTVSVLFLKGKYLPVITSFYPPCLLPVEGAMLVTVGDIVFFFVRESFFLSVPTPSIDNLGSNSPPSISRVPLLSFAKSHFTFLSEMLLIVHLLLPNLRVMFFLTPLKSLSRVTVRVPLSKRSKSSILGVSSSSLTSKEHTLELQGMDWPSTSILS